MGKPSVRIKALLSKCDVQVDQNGLSVEESISSFDDWFEDFSEGGEEFKPNLNGMVENNLTEEEAYFVLAYTGSASSWINSELRSGKTPLCICKQSYIHYLDKSLEKIAPSKNPIVYRMDSPYGDTKEVLKWFKKNKNKVINIPYFLSTAKEDYNNSPIVWKINTLSQNSYGKDISNLTNNKTELEVLFMRNAKFKIVNVDYASSIIFLSEVTQESEFQYNMTNYYFKRD